MCICDAIIFEPLFEFYLKEEYDEFNHGMVELAVSCNNVKLKLFN